MKYRVMCSDNDGANEFVLNTTDSYEQAIRIVSQQSVMQRRNIEVATIIVKRGSYIPGEPEFGPFESLEEAKEVLKRGPKNFYIESIRR